MPKSAMSRFATYSLVVGALIFGCVAPGRAQNYSAYRLNGIQRVKSLTLNLDLKPAGDLDGLFSGKEIYTETATVSNGRLAWRPSLVMYFAANGRAYGISWYDTPWMAHDNNLCISHDAPRSCYRVFRDNTHHLWLQDSENQLVRISRFDNSDTANIKGQFLQARQSGQNQVWGAITRAIQNTGGPSCTDRYGTRYYGDENDDRCRR